jgi:transposase
MGCITECERAGHRLLKKLFANGGYQGPQFQEALANALPQLNVEIVRRSQSGEVLPKRLIVERTFGCLNRCRRLAKDSENLTRTALTFVKLASIRFILRRLCNPS